MTYEDEGFDGHPNEKGGFKTSNVIVGEDGKIRVSAPNLLILPEFDHPPILHYRKVRDMIKFE